MYFEALTTLALLLGLAAGHMVGPGHGLNADPATLDTTDTATFTAAANHKGIVDFALSIIPATFGDAFAKEKSFRCCAITNLVGNVVATVVVAKWEGEVDLERVRRGLGSR